MESIEISNTQYEMLEDLSQGQKTSINSILNLTLEQLGLSKKSRQALLKINSRVAALTQEDTDLIDEIVRAVRTVKRV